MKLTFSSREVSRPSFIELCRYAHDYSFCGIEIYDVKSEKQAHADSIFRPSCLRDGKRWLRNRNLEIAAVSFPVPIDSENVTSADIAEYVDFAESTGIENVIVSVGSDTDCEKLREKLSDTLALCEKYGIYLLFETTGPLADTDVAIDMIKKYAATSVGISWNIRATYFDGKESAEKTIKTLGAYIKYVRIGDRNGDTNVLIGDGTLPTEQFIRALRSLNYDGFLCVADNDEIDDSDIILTHFAGYMSGFFGTDDERSGLFRNRDGSGTFPWKKYEVVPYTFGKVLDIMAETYPDRYAFRYTTLDYTRTYSEFRRDVDRVAAALVASGVKAGSHVAIWASNVPQWFLTFWASVRIGAVLVTVNTAYKIHEVEYLLRQSDTHTLVMTESSKEANYGEIIAELCPELKNHDRNRPLYAEKLPFLRNVVTVGFEMNGCPEWTVFISRGKKVPMEEIKRLASLVKPDDVCNMQYTSGTTGFPKGVMLTHRNIVNNGKIIGDRMDISTADRMMIQVPMFHCFGMVLSMTSVMTHGGTLCPLPYFSPKSSLACITQEKITCFNGVPTMFIAMFAHPDFAKTDFSHMRTGIMAGANCPPDLMKRAAEEMNMREILSVYGQTEAAPGCTMGEVNESIELRTETVGSAFPGVECKIIDPETGEEMPDGEGGEFIARGFNIMKGYYKMPEATAGAIDSNGWLHSGDICCRDKNGYYRVTGRLKDMIIRGGENIYPREIEEFYLTNPKIRDVQVVGVKDEKYGEEACAWIILHENESADIKEMKNFGLSHIARHKVPRYFLFVNEFPMNAAGKILKYKMKEESEKLISEGKLS